ncbi:hypothetical protein J498_1161 [Acinetobacter baumannii 781407]|nr:hypothetical protein CSB70_0452 [Acinetobacter baumannii]AVI36019.1 hypothetical protein CSB68_2777 [Acinetobacter baumannii]EXD54211.1 hypothetical protein J498_1161 [Acinetobacter baumannii 781407]EXR84048.1 hypothetical protein J685_1197 [Acinetobacter baumannii 541915]
MHFPPVSLKKKRKVAICMPISSLALLFRFSYLNFSFNQPIKNPT